MDYVRGWFFLRTGSIPGLKPDFIATRSQMMTYLIERGGLCRARADIIRFGERPVRGLCLGQAKALCTGVELRRELGYKPRIGRHPRPKQEFQPRVDLGYKPGFEQWLKAQSRMEVHFANL